MHLHILSSARRPIPLAYIKKEFPLDHLAIKELIDWGMLKLISNNPAAILVHTHEKIRIDIARISNFDMLLNDWEQLEKHQIHVQRR